MNLSTKIAIRNAIPEDASRLDELLTELIHDESQYDANLNADCVVRDNYGGRIGLDGHKLLVAECDEKTVGYIYGFIYHIPEMLKNPVAILDALFVDEPYRRMGIAHMLFSEFQKFTKEHGACRIDLKVLSRNAEALSLYRSLSFTEVKKYMHLDLQSELTATPGTRSW